MSAGDIYTSRPIRADLVPILAQLRPGARLKITQTVRVGLKSWPVVITGVFRHVDSLATGLSTQRDPHDDIIVPIVHFTKDNGEMSSVALDENTQIEIIPV
jgi:hypothetical protein